MSKLFLELLQDQGLIYIVVGGLNEVTEESSRLFLTRSLLEITTACQNVRLLVSCRNEYCLDKVLKHCELELRVDHHNEPEILAYFDREERILVSQWKELGTQDPVLAAAKVGRDFIAAQSNGKAHPYTEVVINRSDNKVGTGMMLYAKLMMEIIKSLDNPHEIHDELQCLPDGLDQA